MLKQSKKILRKKLHDCQVHVISPIQITTIMEKVDCYVCVTG